MTDAVLEVDRISKRYGATIALHEASLVTGVGELCGLAGRDGAGKTTLLRICAGVVAADSGQVRWRATPIDPATRKRIGYLPATSGLHPEMTVPDQLVYRGGLHGVDTNESHRRAQAWLDRLGRRTLRERRINTLDTDERRLVALIATLLPEPELLLLDEPCAGMSPAGRETVVGVLREQADSGVPVLLSTNDFDFVERQCDRAAILRCGRTVAFGAVHELTADRARLIAVDAPDATPGWTDVVPGCRMVDVDGSRVVLELGPEADEQAVLRAAMATGRVREFTLLRRSLAELYDSAVGS
ncbi:MAG TPA: ATP-binding cassette domain-containing protein [Pseudonocardiaceae bacterium]